jgi:hypothetical protein
MTILMRVFPCQKCRKPMLLVERTQGVNNPSLRTYRCSECGASHQIDMSLDAPTVWPEAEAF